MQFVAVAVVSVVALRNIDVFELVSDTLTRRNALRQDCFHDAVADIITNFLVGVADLFAIRTSQPPQHVSGDRGRHGYDCAVGVQRRSGFGIRYCHIGCKSTVSIRDRIGMEQ